MYDSVLIDFVIIVQQVYVSMSMLFPALIMGVYTNLQEISPSTRTPAASPVPVPSRWLSPACPRDIYIFSPFQNQFQLSCWIMRVVWI
jgi:hypothetical protein